MIEFTRIEKSKSYIRINEEGEPQLVRVEPVIRDGQVDPDFVKIYLDEEGPNEMPRMAFQMMVMAAECIPLEMVAGKQHKRIH